ncbi:MAG: hypothetical protein ACREQW_08230 [Candidatus Binatia bacterium]
MKFVGDFPFVLSRVEAFLGFFRKSDNVPVPVGCGILVRHSRGCAGKIFSIVIEISLTYDPFRMQVLRL